MKKEKRVQTGQMLGSRELGIGLLEASLGKSGR